MATSNHDTQPHVFLTDGIKYHRAILEVVNRFTLNDEQKLAFRVIVNHITERSKVDTQLLMSIFEERETEKSRLIKIIRV